jgi:hypothetical protein
MEQAVNDARATCIICLRDLRENELGRHSCLICQDRGIQMLRALPTLYAQLGDLLQPGAGRGEGRVSGSKSAPLPCSTEVLNLRARGGLVTILASWEDAVRDELGYTAATFRGDYLQTLTGVVAFLVANAPWIYSSFEAVDEFHSEVRERHGHARTLALGERPPHRFGVVCTCGSTLKITLETPGKKCDACGAQYDVSGLRHLPLADRRAA